jgi:hypothetical protein
MNERIKELALEAFQPINDITTEGVADRRTFDQAWFQQYNQKLAELIVKECIKQVFYTIEDEEEDNISSSIRDRIKKRFGVE